MQKIENKIFETNFVIMPKHCNYMYPMVFGGAFFSEMDLCAASCVHRALHDSECDSAVTHKFAGTFLKATECGDTIFMVAEIIEARQKALTIKVEAFREKRAIKGRDKVAEATFVFVTKKQNDFCRHELEL